MGVNKWKDLTNHARSFDLDISGSTVIELDDEDGENLDDETPVHDNSNQMKPWKRCSYACFGASSTISECKDLKLLLYYFNYYMRWLIMSSMIK